ncbi:MAG: hypothetical protein EHM72_05825 [Calditrichaeota bacterium]|nr:MAG: hypothetical protein EHM72_05825 [Calditrichota bacterium]
MRKLLLFSLLFVVGLSFIGIISASDVELKFSHQSHAKAGIDCVTCHTAEESSSAENDLLPSKETCYTCHDKNSTECSTCHQNSENAIPFPRITTYIAHFAHDRHAVKGILCSACHSGVEASTDAFTRHLPSMEHCQSCHKVQETVGYCYLCHAEGDKLTPIDHQLDWRENHGSAAHADNKGCTSCHGESQCLKCHQQDNLDRPVHPLNFIHSHPLEAKIKRDHCYTCHEEQESCITCHREELVMPKNHSAAGWSNMIDGGRHSRQAKLDLDNCMACHNDANQEPICIECHQLKN